MRYDEAIPNVIRMAERHAKFREALESVDIRGANPQTVARLREYFNSE